MNDTNQVDENELEENEPIEIFPLEYVEDWALVSNGWGDLLNEYGKDCWRLRFVLIDEMDEKGVKHPGRRRLIFERLAAGDEG